MSEVWACSELGSKVAYLFSRSLALRCSLPKTYLEEPQPFKSSLKSFCKAFSSP